MRFCRLLLFPGLLLALCTANGQKGFNDYIQVYPIGEDPDINYTTSYTKQEKILFEANPFVRYSFSNNIMKGLMNEEKNHFRAYYVSFTPQLRMYTDVSLPVKTPSYRIQLGTQQVFRIHNNLLTVALESGHYSNGQSRSAFSKDFDDGSPQGDSIYNTITPNTKLSDILNRESGNFSTNLTTLMFSYRINKLTLAMIPRQTHAIRVGAVFYHDRFLELFDFGGFSDQDIKIYGRVRTQVGYEFTLVKKDIRHVFFENMELISGAHKSVNPFRTETGYRIYPFTNMRALGCFVKFIYGHDNYNYRFVDAGAQGSIGITWSIFPPIQIRKMEL